MWQKKVLHFDIGSVVLAMPASPGLGAGMIIHKGKNQMEKTVVVLMCSFGGYLSDSLLSCRFIDMHIVFWNVNGLHMKGAQKLHLLLGDFNVYLVQENKLSFLHAIFRA